MALNLPQWLISPRWLQVHDMKMCSQQGQNTSLTRVSCLPGTAIQLAMCKTLHNNTHHYASVMVCEMKMQLTSSLLSLCSTVGRLSLPLYETLMPIWTTNVTVNICFDNFLNCIISLNMNYKKRNTLQIKSPVFAILDNIIVQSWFSPVLPPLPAWLWLSLHHFPSNTAPVQTTGEYQWQCHAQWATAHNTNT